MRKHYEGEVAKEAEKLIVPYKTELQEKAKRIAALTKVSTNLIGEKENLEKKLAGYKRSYSFLVKLLGRVMSQISDAFSAAIRAIINFAKDGVTNKHRDILTASEAAAIKQIMDDFSPLTDDRKLVGKMLVDFAQNEGELADQEVSRAQNEVTDVANGRYDHIIERTNGQGLSM